MTPTDAQGLRLSLEAEAIHTMLVQFTDLQGVAKGKLLPLHQLHTALATGAWLACARSIRRDTFGDVSNVWHSESRTASCSPRTSALPRGIITAESQRSRLAAPWNA